MNIQKERTPLRLIGRVEPTAVGDTSCLLITERAFPVQQDMPLDLGLNHIRFYIKPPSFAEEEVSLDEGSAEVSSADTNPVDLAPADFTLSDDHYLVFRLIPGWDLDRVRAARVLIVGTGALGNEVAKNLALMGVGTVVVLDKDIIQMDNLSRSILFRAENIGQRKVDVVRQRVGEINSDVRVIALHQDLFQTGLGLFRRVDVVIACVDSLAGRLAVSEACWLLDQPWVDGALGDEFTPFDGYVHTFVPSIKAACFECTLTEEQMERIDDSAGCGELALRLAQQRKIPTTPTCASVIGGIQAQEALKLLHDGSRLENRRFYLPGLTYDGLLQDFSVKPACQTHLSAPGSSVREMPEGRAESTTVRELLSAAAPDAPDQALLFLRERFVQRVWCPSCGDAPREIMCSRSQMDPEDRVCNIHHIARAFEGFSQVTLDSPFADWSLARLGVPLLDIVTVAIADDRGDHRYELIELSGDAPSVLRSDYKRADGP